MAHYPSNIPEYTVEEFSSTIKRTVEDAHGYVCLRGEIIGFKGMNSSSGHSYFQLKEGGAVVDAVIWKWARGRIDTFPENGLEVRAFGKITTFSGKSTYQIQIDAMEPAGIGALMALIEARRVMLEAEGLFDPARKQLLPDLPYTIGIVTSPTGAVIRDMLHRISDRFPTRVMIWGARVQGSGAENDIAAGIDGLNRLDVLSGGALPVPDVIVVARGGGSFEDLLAFQSETVVRAIANSHIAVVSAVGHETDTTLCDFAADVRAPTPTAAAEMICPQRDSLLTDVHGAHDQLLRLVRGHFATEGQRFDFITARLEHFGRSVAPANRDLISFEHRLERLVHAALSHQAGSFHRLAQRLDAHLLVRSYRVRNERLDFYTRRFLGAVRGALRDKSNRLVERSHGVALSHFKQSLQAYNTHHQRLSEQLFVCLNTRMAGLKRRIDHSQHLLLAYSHQHTLERGYVLVSQGGHFVRTCAALIPDQPITLHFADGRLDILRGDV